MGAFRGSKEPPVVFAWSRGPHSVRGGRLVLTDPGQRETWYPFRECYFADGGSHAGEGARSLHVRFAALTAARVSRRKERPPTNGELLRFAKRYGVPDYLLPDNARDAMMGLRGGGYSPLWMTEDASRMGGWLALWEAVSSRDAAGARKALGSLRTYQTKHLVRPVLNLLQPVAWSLQGARPPGSRGSGVPFHSSAFFVPPPPAPETRRALQNAAPLRYRGMVNLALHSSGGAAGDVGQVDLEAVRAAYAAVSSPDPSRRRQTPDLWDRVLQGIPGACPPSDDGFLWFSEQLLQYTAKSAVAQFSEPTTDVGFPGRRPKNLHDAMYLMLGLDVLAGHLVRRCRNSRCRWYPFFVVTDPRERYCCQRCGSSDRVARSRRPNPEP